MPVRPWPTLARSPVADYGIFRVRRDRCTSPRTEHEHDFWVLETGDWVNVIGLTPDERILLIEQYRFGSSAVTLEIPGGTIDAGEAPLAAAERELLEETGFACDSITLLGHVEPNPAIQTNRCYTALALGCRAHPGGQQLDEREDIAVRAVPLLEVPKLLASGQIRHALVWAALMHFDLWRSGRLPTATSL